MQKFKSEKFLLILIIFLAFFLRFYKIGEIPPSLYWDEASLGYNAYSILKTAHDEHGQFLPVTNFAAFGDYKPPGYVYLTVPSIAIFGFDEFAIRFPSALFGVLTVIVTYFITKKLFQNEYVAQLSAFFLAISPWHLQLSRAAFEANAALFFSLFGIYSFIKFALGSRQWIVYSAASFLVALYTFTGQRLFVPLILILLVIQFRKDILKNLPLVLVVTIVSASLVWPMFKFSTQTIEGKLRFDEVTIFKDLKPINDSIVYREEDNFKTWSDIIHNRRFFYLHEYLTHYFDAFSPAFLFTKGDVNPRLSIQKIGELYLIDLATVLAGTYFLFAKKSKFAFLILGWLLISPLGPATARETPHALRMAHILPTFQILSAYGLYYIVQIFKFKKKILIPVILFSIVAFMSYYLNAYHIYWPKTYSGEWQYGYKEAVQITKGYYNQVDNVFVTKGQGRPYVYFLLYMKYDPASFQNNSQAFKDQFFFIDVNGFDKFKFIDSDSDALTVNNSLYILGANNLPNHVNKISTVKNLEGKSVFDIGITN